MSLIDRQQADRIAKWEKEHPEEAKKLRQRHRELYEQLMAKKITLAEFIRQHEIMREEAHKNE